MLKCARRPSVQTPTVGALASCLSKGPFMTPSPSQPRAGFFSGVLTSNQSLHLRRYDDKLCCSSKILMAVYHRSGGGCSAPVHSVTRFGNCCFHSCSCFHYFSVVWFQIVRSHSNCLCTHEDLGAGAGWGGGQISVLLLRCCPSCSPLPLSTCEARSSFETVHRKARVITGDRNNLRDG